MPSTAVGAMWKSRPIVGRATFTIVMSMMFMNIADTNTVPTTIFWLRRGMTTRAFSRCVLGPAGPGGATSRRQWPGSPVTLCGRRSVAVTAVPPCDRAGSPTVSATLAGRALETGGWTMVSPSRNDAPAARGAVRERIARRRHGDVARLGWLIGGVRACRRRGAARAGRHRGPSGSAARARPATPAPLPAPRRA